MGCRDNGGWTPLHPAALNGHLNTVRLLLECGADRNIRDDSNKSPLDLASDNHNLEVANLLSQSAVLGEEVDPTASSANPHDQRLDVVQSPRSHGEVESSNDEQPLLCTASRNGRVDVVRSLLDRGSDVEETGSLRQTALSMASEFGHIAVAKLLIERGANVNSRDVNGSSPLHQASQYRHFHIVRLLLDHNADVNARKRDQMTALDFVAYNDDPETAELLLERGANANLRNSYGRTPRQEALVYGSRRIAELLSRHGASPS